MPTPLKPFCDKGINENGQLPKLADPGLPVKSPVKSIRLFRPHGRRERRNGVCIQLPHRPGTVATACLVIAIGDSPLLEAGQGKALPRVDYTLSDHRGNVHGCEFLTPPWLHIGFRRESSVSPRTRSVSPLARLGNTKS